MKFFIGLSFTFLIISLVNCAEELKIDVVSTPEICEVKSKSGDMLTMHYTGTLSDGKKFDSSCHQQQRERTFIMIKPDGVQRGFIGEIIKRFEQRGLKLVAIKFVWPTGKLLHKHYEALADKSFFPNLIKYVSSGPVVPMVWEGWNSVKIGRILLGATHPIDSAPGTIRGDFGIDVQRNIIHGSDSVESASQEIKLWFTDEEIINWNSNDDNWLYPN